MPFQFNWTEEASCQFNQLKHAAIEAKKNRAGRKKSKQSKQEGLFKQVAEALKKLGKDPKYPGLNCHPYSKLTNPHDQDGKVWEAYAQNDTPGAYRIFWCYGPSKGLITIIAITPHP